VLRWLADAGSALVDLVLPTTCAGCGAGEGSAGLCVGCAGALAAAVPARVRPAPEPAGLPRTVALAGYGGALSAAILQYKERGRYGLVQVLGERLAGVVTVAAPQGRPLLLVPVPATSAAARRRHGDHMARLARHAAATLCRSGRAAAVAYPVKALPRPDSAGLSAADRAVAASASFVVRPRSLPAVRAATGAGVTVVLVDDVITTGATLSAVATRLRAAGVPVSVAAVLAATPRHGSSRFGGSSRSA